MDPTAEASQTIDAQLLDVMLRVGSRWVLWLLLGLSLVAVAVMLERAWFFFTARLHRKDLDRALAALKSSGPKAALEALGKATSMEAAVARSCIDNVGEGAHAMEEHLTATIESERLRYERGLAFIGTLGNNAPFVGLFGTVLGIIRAFHDLAANTAQGAAAVMAGIAEALVATGVGLLVALPAVAIYNLFSRYVETSAAESLSVGHRVLAWVKGASERGAQASLGEAKPDAAPKAPEAEVR